MEVVFILAALLGLLLFRTPVAIAVGALGVILLFLKGFPLVAIPQRLFGAIDSFELLAVPMFLLMSNVLLKAGVGRDLYAAVQSWVGHWPGGLGVATIVSCTFFSAICGSSVATAATIGTVAIPEMNKRGYQNSFVYGLLAAGGTLGILIPPSIPLIIYGIVSETSISTLFLAGVGPGLLLSGIFIVYAMVYSKWKGGYTPCEKAPMSERISTTLRALPTIFLAVVIVGSIYAGIATPSESAGLGFVVALIMTFAMKRMTWAKLSEAVEDSFKTTVMILLIIAGAKVFSYAITLYMVPQNISQFLTANITDQNLFILAVALVLIVMGFFLEALSMLLIMVPVLLTAVLSMNIDPVWFGIFFVVLIETALITPPVGLNLFVIQAVGRAKIEEVVKGAWPFAVMMVCVAALIWFVQGIVTFIPYS